MPSGRGRAGRSAPRRRRARVPPARRRELQPDNAEAWYSLGDFDLVDRHCPRAALPALDRFTVLNRPGPAERRVRPGAQARQLGQADLLRSAGATRRRRRRAGRPAASSREPVERPDHLDLQVTGEAEALRAEAGAVHDDARRVVLSARVAGAGDLVAEPLQPPRLAAQRRRSGRCRSGPGSAAGRAGSPGRPLAAQSYGAGAAQAWPRPRASACATRPPPRAAGSSARAAWRAGRPPPRSAAPARSRRCVLAIERRPSPGANELVRGVERGLHGAPEGSATRPRLLRRPSAGERRRRPGPGAPEAVGERVAGAPAELALGVRDVEHRPADVAEAGGSEGRLGAAPGDLGAARGAGRARSSRRRCRR